MRKGFLILLVSIAMAGCKKDDTKTEDVTPAVAVLSFPDQNAICTTGSIVSDTVSTITFKWSAADNTETYDLHLKNLLTAGITIKSTSQTELPVSLSRNTPYSWYVTSKSTKTNKTAESATWKFYNAGKGTINYAPFPADIISPIFAQSVTTSTVNLTWKGNAVLNGTIASYDIYFGTSNNPPLFKGAITDSFLNNVNVAAKSTYYWKVITRDIFGNTSDSGLYMFTAD